MGVRRVHVLGGRGGVGGGVVGVVASSSVVGGTRVVRLWVGGWVGGWVG